MKFSIRLTYQDYLNAELLNLNSKVMVRLLPSGLILIGIISIIKFLLAFQEVQHLAIALIGFGLIAFVLVVRFVLIPNRVRKIFSQQKSLHQETEIAISEEGLILENQIGNAMIPWKNFIKWLEDDDVLLLFHSDLLMNMIPKRDIPNKDVLDKIYIYLSQNGVRMA